ERGRRHRSRPRRPDATRPRRSGAVPFGSPDRTCSCGRCEAGAPAPALGLIGARREAGHPLGEPRLLAVRRVLVQDTLGGGLVDALDGDPQLGLVVAGDGGLLGALDAGLQLGAHGLVAQAALLVLT